jgi:4-amino-4-deoxy-L-arabinose transferase-like glycosyltransferase
MRATQDPPTMFPSQTVRSPHTFAEILLLCLLLFLAGGSALHESATVDEISHVGSGLSYLQKLDLRLNPEHPPLAKAFAAIPLALRGVSADYSGPAWMTADDFWPAYIAQWFFGDAVLGRWNPWKATLLWARVPMLLLTLLLGWIVYRYATQLGGRWGGLLCLAAFVSTPAFLTFGPLVLTDVPTTFFTLAAAWQLAELWNNPSRRNTFLFALAFAGALLTKFTGLLLFVVIGALFLQSRFWPTTIEPTVPSERKEWRRARWRAIFRATFFTLLLVYLVYFVLSWNQPDYSLSYLNAGPFTAFIRRLLLPIWLYFRGLLLVLVTGSRTTYLFGKSYPHGIPYYFPVVVTLKSTLEFLLLLLISAYAAVATAAKRKRHQLARAIAPSYRSHWRVLLITFWVFLAVCLLSRLDISIRHFLVPLVLLTLMLAPLPNLIGTLRGRRAWSYATALLAVSSLLTVVFSYPNYFPYVNALSMGRRTYTLLNDSNVSWNGALPQVEVFAHRHGLSRLNLDWASLSDPALVVPEAVPWDCQAPSAQDAGQWSVVAAVSILENHNCAWLQKYPSEAIAGGEMYAFHLPVPIPAAGSPDGPPAPSEHRLMWGVPMDLRAFAIDLERHPQTIPERMRQMMANMQRQSQPK